MKSSPPALPNSSLASGPKTRPRSSVTAQFKITGEGGGQWWVSTKDGKVASGEGTADKPDVTLSCSDKDALALCTGDADAMSMLGDGRLSFSGDLGLMRKLVPLLKRMSSE